MSRIDAAKGEITEDSFSPEQISDLHDAFEALRPTVDAEYSRGGDCLWPWKRYHPWRHAVGQFFWRLGYRIMHGRSL